MEYTWNIGPLDVKLFENGLTNAVYGVNWRLIGTDGEYSASVYGYVGVPAPDGDFTPYDELTKAQVQGWVEEALGAEQVAQYKANIADQIELQKNPVYATIPSPWI